MKRAGGNSSGSSLSVTSSLSEEANTNLIAHNNDRLPLRTSSLSEETKTNLIAHNNSGYSLRSFQRETYFAKGPFPPCSFRYFRERSIILSISSKEKANLLLCGFLSFSSDSRTKRSASSPVNTGVLLISNAIVSLSSTLKVVYPLLARLRIEPNCHAQPDCQGDGKDKCK